MESQLSTLAPSRRVSICNKLCRHAKGEIEARMKRSHKRTKQPKLAHHESVLRVRRSRTVRLRLRQHRTLICKLSEYRDLQCGYFEPRACRVVFQLKQCRSGHLRPVRSKRTQGRINLEYPLREINAWR